MIIILVLHLSYNLSLFVINAYHIAYHCLLIWYIYVMNYINNVKIKIHLSISYFLHLKWACVLALSFQ